jgi:repressor LexA
MRQSNSQQMVLSFIEQYQDENQRPPTIREIQDHCGFKSPRAVSYILEKLEAARLIIRRAHSRGVQLTKATVAGGSLAVQLPLFASIPAGSPDEYEVVEAPEKLRFIPTTLGISNPGKAFAVRVRGDSMIDAGIFSGDIVVLEKKEAKTGDIVAALVDGENTLKRLVNENGRVYLKAENRDYPNIEPEGQLDIQGVVVSVLRTFNASQAA